MLGSKISGYITKGENDLFSVTINVNSNTYTPVTSFTEERAETVLIFMQIIAHMFSGMSREERNETIERMVDKKLHPDLQNNLNAIVSDLNN